MLRFIDAEAKHAELLRDTLIASKGYWGYSQEQLDHLWLLPKAIGKGYGNLVFEQIIAECNRLDISNFYIISDPDAERFYLKKGALKVGEVYSEAQKRMLPKLAFII